MRDPRTMQPAAINRELDQLDRKRNRLNDRFIEAGRGHETWSETLRRGDPLALEAIAVSERQGELRREIARRMGPGHPRRLPRGFGPLKMSAHRRAARLRGAPQTSAHHRKELAERRRSTYGRVGRLVLGRKAFLSGPKSGGPHAYSYEGLVNRVVHALNLESHLKAWARRLPSWTDVFVDDRREGVNYGHVTIYPNEAGGGVVHVYGGYAGNIAAALKRRGIIVVKGGSRRPRELLPEGNRHRSKRRGRGRR